MLLPSKGLHHFEWHSLYGEISSRWPFMTNTGLLVLCTDVMCKMSQTLFQNIPIPACNSPNNRAHIYDYYDMYSTSETNDQLPFTNMVHAVSDNVSYIEPIP